MRLIIGNITVILHLVISDKLGNCFGFFFSGNVNSITDSDSQFKEGWYKNKL